MQADVLTLPLADGATVVVSNVTDTRYWIKFTVTLPKNSMVGVGFGSSMTDTNMILFTTGADPKAQNCYSGGHDKPSCYPILEDYFTSTSYPDDKNPDNVVIECERAFDIKD